ncbi:MAG: GvpL/GvpF family gas vesicle protein [Pseudomonadota bacterium]
MSSHVMLIGLAQGSAAAPRTAPFHGIVRSRGWSALSLYVDPGDLADETDTLALARRQNAVLSAYIAEADVLPVAFGSVFSGPEAVAEHIARYANTWGKEALRLNGLCEYSLHIVEAKAFTTPILQRREIGGKAFLLSKQRRRDARASLTEDRAKFVSRLMSAIQRSSVDTADISRAGEGRIADVAFLQPRGEVHALMGELDQEADQANRLGLDCRIVGPCPAYSFVQPELIDGG